MESVPCLNYCLAIIRSISMKAALPLAVGVALASVTVVVAEIPYPQTLEELNTWYVESPTGSNAATYYLKAFDALKITDADPKALNLPLIGKSQLPSPEKRLPAAMAVAVGAFVERNKSAFPLLAQGANFAQSRYPMDFTKHPYIPLPHLGNIKLSAEVLELYGISKALTGRGDLAGESVLTGLALGRSLEAEPLYISQQVRVSCTVVTVENLEQALNRVLLPPDTLDQLYDCLSQYAESEAKGIGFTRATVAERILAQANFDVLPERQVEIMMTIEPKPRYTNTLQLLEKNRSADLNFIKNTFDEVLASRQQDFSQRLVVNRIFERRAAEAVNKEFVISAFELNGTTNVASREARSLTYLRLGQTAVALERYRAFHDNQYPDSLLQLTPTYLQSIPEDPFDGQPLRFRRTANGYILYSVGYDLDDDSGRRGKWSDGDLVFSVLNPPTRRQ